MVTIQLGSGIVQAGAGLNFAAITAAVVGGTLLAGGRGGVLHSIVGVLSSSCSTNGLVLIGVSPYVQGGVQGSSSSPPSPPTAWPLRTGTSGQVSSSCEPVRPARAGPEVRGLVKRYPGVKALDGVDFVVRQHEVLGLAGENGAGKSTLLKTLVGLVRPDAGEIYVRGEKVRLRSVVDAADHGIGMVFQEQSLVPNLTAAENILLGSEGARRARRRLPLGRHAPAAPRSSSTRSARRSTRWRAPTRSPSPTGRWSRSRRCCASRSAPTPRR